MQVVCILEIHLHGFKVFRSTQYNAYWHYPQKQADLQWNKYRISKEIPLSKCCHSAERKNEENKKLLAKIAMKQLAWGNTIHFMIRQ